MKLKAFPIAQRPIEAFVPRFTPTSWPAIIITALSHIPFYLPRASIRIYPPREPPTIVNSFPLQAAFAYLMAVMQF
jgi:hypothetical protein